jgi:hypothetical protein
MRLWRTHQGDHPVTSVEQGLHQMASDHAIRASYNDGMRPHELLLFLHQSLPLSG